MENETSRYRQLSGVSQTIYKIILFEIPIIGLLYILSIHQYFRIALFREQYIGLFIALMLSAVFIGIPGGSRASRSKVPWYDWILAILGLVVGLYLFIFYPKIINLFGIVTTDRLIICVLAILLVIESLRRMLGWVLVGVVLFFLAYSFFTPYFPGALKGQRTSFDQLFNYLYLDSSSLLGMIGIAATIALAFILFGQVLLNFKGGDIINNLSISLFGRFRGGPAKTSVVGSTLVGSITGGPVANVILTGSMTIPLMIKNKHSRVEAGAIEAVASTGGSIMPPVMGIAAFVIAETLGVPYNEIALAALIPALLYYVCLFVQIDLKAAKNGLNGLSKSEIPALGPVLRTALLIIPIFAFLIYLLFIAGYPPTTAGVYSAVLAFLFLIIQKGAREGLRRRIMDTLLEAGRTVVEIAVVLAAAGIIIGIVGITGLGSNLVMFLANLGEYGLPVLLIASAMVSVILGMGMPSVAAYTLVAVLVAPAMVELGVVPLAAHLFVFYFAIVSNFTPPIALASFAAAPIAQASPTKISFEAMRLGIVAYIVPFIFVYSPEILLGYKLPTAASILSIITAFIAVSLLSASLVGYLFRNLSMVKRIILTLSAICLLVPIQGYSVTMFLNVIGFVIAVVIFLMEWIASGKMVKSEVSKTV